MTVKEAFKDIDKILYQVAIGNIKLGSHFLENFKKTVKFALEKRIPKKPNTETINHGIDISGEYDIDSNYICPCCGGVVGDYETEEHYCAFCYNCGQKIDWSDTE